MERPIRILFVADSHLGLDLPARPRVKRRRRGDDFLANHARALAPAFGGEVDVVVHGGDVFHRPRIAKTLAHQAYEPLARLARRMPVLVVPGNHERGRLPHPELLGRARVFDEPRTYVVEVRGVRLAFAGFPYERRGVRCRFGELTRRTGWRAAATDASVLCIHHCVEGATVGPGDFTFTTGDDVIRGGDIPSGLAAVLSGHIHRHQVLTHDLAGRSLAAPVLYPGSVERTSLAEQPETKGYLTVELDAGANTVQWRFTPLPARPMVVRDVHVAGTNAKRLDAIIRGILRETEADAVLKLRVTGVPTDEAATVLSAPRLRALAPVTMNVEVSGLRRRVPGVARRRRARDRGRIAHGEVTAGHSRRSAQLELLP